MTTAKRLAEGSLLTVSAATYYTTPVNTKCVIKKLTCTNPTAGAVKVTIYLVPSGGSAGDANTIRKVRTVGPYEVFEVYEAEDHVLEAGDFIQALADVGGAVALMASGIEIT